MKDLHRFGEVCRPGGNELARQVELELPPDPVERMGEARHIKSAAVRHLGVCPQCVDSSEVDRGGVLDERDNVGALNARTDDEGEKSLIKGNVGVAQAEETLAKLLSIVISDQNE